MSTISKMHARQIIDSRGNPTLEADVFLTSGTMGRAAVPSGASTGKREAIELRDGGQLYGGKGVTKAVAHVNHEIQQALLGMDVFDQQSIDQKMIDLDGSDNKARLGANAILSVSLAAAHAAANDKKKPLFAYLQNREQYTMPVPMMNIINGGAHADNNVDFQEFMILPLGAPSLAEAVRYGAEVFHSLKAVLKSKKLNTSVGDEGGFAPDIKSNVAALDLIYQAIRGVGFEPGKEIYLGLDVASSEFYRDGLYHLGSENRKLSARELTDMLQQWIHDYAIITVEDGLAEDDWDGWAEMTELLGKQVQLVGDDLFVTNTRILQQGIEKNVANSILIKVNQIGTLTETLAAIGMASDAGYSSVISHRSGETSDTTIADLAVATGVGQIKTGSMSRSDRVSKYNQLIRIEETLQDRCVYPGKAAFEKYMG